MTPLRFAIVLACFFTGITRADEFERTIAPILLNHCVECHSGSSPSGGLDVTSERGFRAGGKKKDASLVLDRVHAGEMPPPKGETPRPLPKEQQAALKKWMEAGAVWPKGRVLDWFERTIETRAGRDWWSLQPVVVTSFQSQVPSPIDQLVGSKLKDKGFDPAPETDKRTLIRRLYVDLVGFPPTFEQVEAFANDSSPDAYPKLVEKLLASPHYGERWCRHWLDIVRYAETCGYERDQVKPHVWKYRDYVVKAFNDDLSYDRFVKEQLAGDELPDRTERTAIATGFIRLGTWNDEPNDPNEYKYDRLEDMVGATSSAFLGLTVKCARCHDHKFDAIRQTDYYRMAAAFWAGFIEPGPREHLGGPDPKQIGAEIFSWTDRGRVVPPIKLLKKGDPNRPGEVVEPGHLSVIPSLDKPISPPAADAKTTGRRLALANWIVDPKNPLTARVWVNRIWQFHFGQGIVPSPDNFGFTGEKPTHPELLDWLAGELMKNNWSTKHIHRMILNSRTYRQASLHPKHEQYAKSDAGNKLWWRFERRRVEAEVLRDSMLFVAGNLKLDRIGGPSFSPEIATEALEGLSTKSAAWKASPPEEQGRRSLYIFSKRGLLPPQLTAFDFPDTTLPCGQRDSTTVAPQALTLMNNRFAHEQSDALAKRAMKESDEATRIVAAWRTALARDPSASEAKAAAEHLTKQRANFASAKDAEFRALASLCHVLLNANEFVYVD